MTNPVITIDGPSGAGKGTLVARLAHYLGWPLLDSGALYRVLAYAAQQKNIPLGDELALSALARQLDLRFELEGDLASVILDDADVSMVIRTEEGGRAASQVAVFKEVRAALLERQRAFSTAKGLIADGRDMGTVVFPDAPLKIFLTASAEERARRRYNQLKQKGIDVSLRALFEDIQARDARDMNRAHAPLVPAEDALVLDSTELSIDQVFEKVLQEARQRGLCS